MTLRLLRKDPCQAHYVSDQALVDAIRTNENKALQCLYLAIHDKIEHFVTNNNGSQQDAEDVFQEGMIALWNNIKNGKYVVGKAKLSTYLFQICKYRWMEHLKSAKYRYSSRLESGFDKEEESDVSDMMEETERLNYFSDLFNELGEKCKRLLSLFYYESTPMVEIAEVMGYTTKSVKNEKYRCMKKLKSMHHQKN